MTNYELSEPFKVLKEFVIGLPKTFYKTGSVIHEHRNIIKRITTAEGDFIVKNFKGMYMVNRIAFSLFVKSKAERSYMHAEILKKHGFTTPPNVGWLDRYVLGLLMESYYVSVYSPWDTFHHIMTNQIPTDKEQRTSLVKHLAALAFKLHKAGIYHKDFSVRNILLIPPLQSYNFALVDLNRMQFGEKSYSKGLKNFKRLDMPEEDMNNMIREYAILSGESPEDSIKQFWTFKRNFSSFRKMRKKIKKYTLNLIKGSSKPSKAKH